MGDITDEVEISDEVVSAGASYIIVQHRSVLRQVVGTLARPDRKRILLGFIDTKLGVKLEDSVLKFARTQLVTG